MKEWLLSIDWNTVLVSSAGFGAAIATAIISALAGAKNTQRKHLTEMRSNAYTEYMNAAYAALFNDSSLENQLKFYAADWQARMVASKQTSKLLFVLRQRCASLHSSMLRTHKKEDAKSGCELKDILPLMDELAQSMMRDLKSRYR